jgi:predicted nucleotidyltransferase
MRNVFGLIKRDIDLIIKALGNFKEIDRALIFGSRALGNYKKGSDIDIAISGEAVTRKTIYDLNELLNEEYPLPYFFDLLHYEEIECEKLIEHINTVGIEVYSK